jgi:hypothetical protein
MRRNNVKHKNKNYFIIKIKKRSSNLVLGDDFTNLEVVILDI